jgi:hypothetical protein
VTDEELEDLARILALSTQCRRRLRSSNTARANLAAIETLSILECLFSPVLLRPLSSVNSAHTGRGRIALLHAASHRATCLAGGAFPSAMRGGIPAWCREKWSVETTRLDNDPAVCVQRAAERRESRAPVSGKAAQPSVRCFFSVVQPDKPDKDASCLKRKPTPSSHQPQSKLARSAEAENVHPNIAA